MPVPATSFTLSLEQARLGGLETAPGTVLPTRLTSSGTGGEMLWTFPVGALDGANWLSADFLYRSPLQACFRLDLREGEKGPCFFVTFSVLPGIGARLRLPLVRLDLNAWALFREGGLLKRCCYGDRVRPGRIDRIRLSVERQAEQPVTWEFSGLATTVEEPDLMADPVLLSGPLADPLGQSRFLDWTGRTRSVDELRTRIERQLASAPLATWPEHFSRWGGWTKRKFEASGFFRVERDTDRWWLADPEGHAYWSAALDCVRTGTPASIVGIETAMEDYERLLRDFPSCLHRREHEGVPTTTFDYIRANLIRVFGEEAYEEKWADIVMGLLRQTGFNGFGNWSHSAVASARGFPYVHPLAGEFARAPKVFRDFPDVWHPDWPADVADYARQLEAFRGDPALIGYFLMNEPKWGFASQTPAEGMLLNAPPCPAREALAAYLRDRYKTNEALARTWKMETSFDAVARGPNPTAITEAARPALEAFSTVMATKFFGDLSDACREVDPDHLNLGVRYYILPPDWLAPAMGCLDVFSMNCYQDHIPAAEIAAFAATVRLPVLIGEWHFGALDAGLPMAGICRVANQTERGKAYRSYLEHAAAQPWCVGAHYFQLYDQPCLGRFDGENWNIGILDICHRVYEEFATSARASHEVLYEVAAGNHPPFNEPVGYRPRHFC